MAGDLQKHLVDAVVFVGALLLFAVLASRFFRIERRQVVKGLFLTIALFVVILTIEHFTERDHGLRADVRDARTPR